MSRGCRMQRLASTSIGSALRHDLPEHHGAVAAGPPDICMSALLAQKGVEFRAQVIRAADRSLHRDGAEPDDLLYVVSEPPTIGSRAIKFDLERYDTLLMRRRRCIAGQRQ